jgi:thioredoxin 2
MSQTIYSLRCLVCGAKNRIPESKIGQRAKCGKCQSPLETQALTASEPVMISDANFQSKVIQSPLPVLIDCWAPWCSACQMVGPIVRELAAEWKGRVRVGKLNVDTNPYLSSRYDMRSIPTLLIFDRGNFVDSLIGAAPKSMIQQKMAPYL